MNEATHNWIRSLKQSDLVAVIEDLAYQNDAVIGALQEMYDAAQEPE